MLRATYVGLDRDLVENGAQARIDGAMDGHFQAQTNFSFWQPVTRITMYSADAAGNPTGGHRWDTQEGSSWLLGVLTNELLLDPTHVPMLGTFNGQVTFDLYAGDPGWFRAGNHVVIEFGMGDRQAVSTLVTLTGGAPLAGGAPAGGAPGAGAAPAATPRDLLVSYDAGWVGMEADVVG
jgi:hypothetical protein